ncbi:MAG TPA: DEAD/DEAH box helicase [Stellaceae bacterium]|nr:DEAD/DEAH box helicase [Stellaceae bacterium]
MTDFSDFGLAAPILQALATEGYETPTPIQAQAIPHILGGRDLCGIAQTGTGKTAAFALPILHRLSTAPGRRLPRACRVLVLSPTRELASQIADNFRAYGRQLRLSTAVVFGGVTLGSQQRVLAPGVDVLVATPGRLLDLIDRRDLSLENVQVLVLDEADRMLDLGFIHALRRIVKLLPRERQTLLFSATMPRAIATLAEDYLTDPVKVTVTPVATTVERVDQGVLFVPMAQKRHLLAGLLRDPAFERVLVFTRTKHGADRVVRHLLDGGIEAVAIHGNKSQPQRERALSGFRAGQTRVLVATDIAARGIDVEAVTHVINFELPNVPEDYVHRIGRTARAGAAGIAISFCGDDERPYLRDIEKLTRLKLNVLPLPANLPAAGRSETPEERPQRRPEHAEARGFNGSGPHRNAGKGHDNASPRRASSNGQRAAPAKGQRPAPANGNQAPAAEGSGLPAFLRRDGGGGRPPKGSWRPRGADRATGNRATGNRAAAPR